MLFHLSMRDGQQNQSIRYEVKVFLRQTAYYDREDTLTWCDCFVFFFLIDYFSLNVACITHEMKIVLQVFKKREFVFCFKNTAAHIHFTFMLAHTRSCVCCVLKIEALEELKRESVIRGTVISQFQKLFSFYEFYTAERPILPRFLKQSLFKDPNLSERGNCNYRLNLKCVCLCLFLALLLRLQKVFLLLNYNYGT